MEHVHERHGGVITPVNNTVTTQSPNRQYYRRSLPTSQSTLAKTAKMFSHISLSSLLIEEMMFSNETFYTLNRGLKSNNYTSFTLPLQ